MHQEHINNLVNILGNFKDLKRKGWLNRQVTTPESDAEHSFSLAITALLLATPELDLLKCLKLALFHDLPEIYAGDFTPLDNITHEQKLEKEQNAAQQIAQELNWPELLDLFAEYDNKSSKESIFINALDKLDNVITARYYDNNKRSPTPLLPEFSNYAKRCLTALDNGELEKIKNIFYHLVY